MLDLEKHSRSDPTRIHNVHPRYAWSDSVWGGCRAYRRGLLHWGWSHQHGKVWAKGYSETLITALVSSGVVYGPEVRLLEFLLSVVDVECVGGKGIVEWWKTSWGGAETARVWVV